MSDVERLRSSKTTLNDSVVETKEELQEAELPAQEARRHAYKLQQTVGDGDGGGSGESIELALGIVRL